MTTQEIANRLVELCQQGAFAQALEELYSPDAESIENPSAPTPYVKGLDKIIEKGKIFNEMIEESYGGEVGEPIVAGNFFSVRMMMDVKYKGREREQSEEICVYEVKDGKIVKEQFFYTFSM